MSVWEIWIDDPRGNRLELVELAAGFEVGRAANYPSAWSLNLPAGFDEKLLRVDNLVEFWRSTTETQMKALAVGTMRRFLFEEDENGLEKVLVGGPDMIDLLGRRIVAYAAGSAEAEKTDFSDDMCKAVVRENLGSLAAAGRDLSGLGISVAMDFGLGPSITKAFSHQNVLDVLQKIAAASAENGTELFFDLTPRMISQAQMGFLFETWVGRRGMDRSASSLNPTYFGDVFGNLRAPKLEVLYGDEVNHIYAGGQGEEAERIIVEASDAERVGMSVWNRREGWVDARDVAPDDTAMLTARAETALREGRPVARFSAALVDMPGSRFGVDWEYGDVVSVDHRGFAFDGMIRAVRVRVDEGGQETVEAKIEAVL